MTVKFTNNASTTIGTGINASATSLTVASASSFPSLSGADDYCYLTLQGATNTTREVVKATALSSNTFTIVRAQDNTSAASWVAGDVVELRMTAALLTDVIDAATVEGVKTNYQYTPTAGQTVFSGADNASATMIINQAALVSVYMNGVRLVQGTDYSVSSANNTVTLGVGATTADIIDIEVYGNFVGQSGAAVGITGGSITGTAITATSLGATGTATLNTLVSNNAAISGGSLDGVTIGGTTRGAISGNAISGTSFASTGNMTFGDNDKAIFGAGSDLQIWHDGSNSYVKDAGAGNLKLQGASYVLMESDEGKIMLRGQKNNALQAYYDGFLRLATSSSGIDVTGTVTADGLVVDTGSVGGFKVTQDAGAGVRLTAYQGTTNSNVRTAYVDAQVFVVSTGEPTGTTVTERLRIASDGNVGIGQAPSNFSNWRILEIKGGTAGAMLNFENSSSTRVSTLAYDDGSDSLRIQNFLANPITFETNNTERMRIDSSGNVEIGGNTFAAGKLRVYDSSGNHVWLKGRASDGTSSVSFRNNADNTYNGRIQVADTGGMLFQVAGSTRATIDASGNLLVGKTANNITDTGAVIRSTGETFLTRSGNPLSLNRLSSDGNVLEIRKDSAVVGAIACRSSGGNLQIHTDESGIDFGGSGYLPMRGSTITDNNLDIGSSSFRYKNLYLSGELHIGNGTVTAAADARDLVVGGSTGNNGITIGSATSGSGSLRFADTGGTGRGIILYNQSTDFMGFHSAGVEKMRLTAGGDVCLGSTGVIRGSSQTGVSIEAEGRLYLSRGTSTGGFSHLVFYNGNGLVGTVSTSGSATAYNTSSDQRLKDNIVDAPSASDDIDAIQVRSFDWKADGEHQKYGMVAQELQTVAPEAVSGNADSEEMMGVDYSKLVPMMLKEIQSLRDRIAALES